MCAAQSHEFWKQRVYKEERDRYLLHARHQIPESPSSVLHVPPNTKAYRASESPRRQIHQSFGAYASICPQEHSSPSRHNYFKSSLPNLYGKATHVNSVQARISPARYGKTSNDDRNSIPYRPRGPPATKHGVDTKYHTFTYKDQAFLENIPK
eukprot:TRINITY_DN11661_c0_g2_i2.p1 TRINITY_DN11661_c0_g2~~TRINITY_DN11661_c0_g2_i2.p1  ORF type:complete len:153 (+),score=26.00 TRINITY_DN11661_c0_g2_i2:60-518(+)